MTSPLVAVQGVHKKFCSDLKSSLFYGYLDMAREIALRGAGEPRLRSREFWALRDINFEVRRGETLGLIGHNGAGKSTLMKLLFGALRPDAGRIRLWGRIGALVALGTGMNPILTGRENIRIAASFIGLSPREIEARVGQIIEFAEIGEFIDAPLRNYSSGMKVRLGFAVAIHMNPDLLLVDEVLSVGDSSFRQRCVDWFKGFQKRGGSVLFVSHNTTMVEAVCDRAILLEKGQIKMDGAVREVASAYEDGASAVSAASLGRRLVSQVAEFVEAVPWIEAIRLVEPSGAVTTLGSAKLEFEIQYAGRKGSANEQTPIVSVRKDEKHDSFLMDAMVWHRLDAEELSETGTLRLSADLPALTPGTYVVELGIIRNLTGHAGEKWIRRPTAVGTFTVSADAYEGIYPGAPARHLAHVLPPVYMPARWRADERTLSSSSAGRKKSSIVKT